MTRLTDAEREQAKIYWSIGWSAGRIAEAISREAGRIVTRNAIIGMVFRGKWPRRADLPQGAAYPSPPQPIAAPSDSPSRRPRAREPQTPPQNASERQVEAPAPEAAPDNIFFPSTFFPPPGAGKAVFELRDNQCRFPAGDPASPEFRFCSAAKALDGPYCRAHAARSFFPVNRKW